MELSVDTTNKTNLQNQVQFKATENSAKLFSMLSSYLYANKELAVLHELSSNALDAHRMIGKGEVPIEVHLPTSLSPNLRICDSGPGLSHDNVIKFLTTYGESNKTGSNDLIGGYGIGAKSPAAVTDTWQIISKHNGEGIQYMVAVDPNGIPSLSKLREFDATDSGLEVVVPVHSSKIRVWEEAARTAYQFYPIKPSVKGKYYPILESDEENNILAFPGVGRCVRGNYGNGKVVAILGVRGYKIDLKQIADKIDPKYFALLGQVSTFLTFATNDLDIDLSRENIRYSTKTIDCLSTKYSQFASLVEEYIKNEMNGVSLLIETRVKAKSLYDSFGSAVFQYTEAKGIVYSSDLDNLSFPISSASVYKIGYHGKITALTTKFTCGKRYYVGLNNVYVPTTKTCQSTVAIRLSSFNNVIFCLNDQTGLASRIRNQMSLNPGKIYVIAESFSEFGSEVEALAVKASTFPVVVKAPTIKTKSVKSDLYKKEGNRFFKITEEDLALKLKDGYSTLLWTEIESNFTKDAEKIDFIQSVGGMSLVTIGIKKGKPKPTLLNTCKSVNECYDELISTFNTERQSYVDDLVIRNMKDSNWYRRLSVTVPQLPVDSDLYKVLAEIGSLVESKTKIHSFSMVKEKLDLTQIVVSDNITKCNNMLDELGSKYPMLSLMLLHTYVRIDGYVLNGVVDYVNLIERNKK